jgi:hypothetical protein
VYGSGIGYEGEGILGDSGPIFSYGHPAERRGLRKGNLSFPLLSFCFATRLVGELRVIGDFRIISSYRWAYRLAI